MFGMPVGEGIGWLGSAWRGEIGLRQAAGLIALPTFILGCWLIGAPAHLVPESFFRAHPFLCFWLIGGFKILICSFAVVCVWRAARIASEECDIDESTFAPSAARIGIIIYALVMLTPSAAFLYLATVQYIEDPIGFQQKLANAMDE